MNTLIYIGEKSDSLVKAANFFTIAFFFNVIDFKYWLCKNSIPRTARTKDENSERSQHMSGSLLNAGDLEWPAVSHYICGFQTATCRCMHMNNFEHKSFNPLVENRSSQMCKVTCIHGLVTEV